MKKLPQSKEVQGMLAALQRAALRAREIAIRTNTAVIIAKKDGQCERIESNALKKK